VLNIFPDLKSGKGNTDFRLLLNPLTDIYFSRNKGDLGMLHGNVSLVKILIAIAILIIVIACINFINISIARSLKRVNEVGIKKVVGANRFTLVKQFLSESFTISIISLVLGLLLAKLLLPYFNNLGGKPMHLAFFDFSFTLPVLTIFIVVTGLLAGAYPACFISSYKAISIIQGKLYGGRRSPGFRRGLILFQFLISVMLINGSLLIYKQLKYTREKDLGFEKERILTVDATSRILGNRDIVKEKLLQHSEITYVSYSYTIPGSDLNYEGFRIKNEEVRPLVFSIDPDYLKSIILQ
jgi:putative ABC transport system permease protein